MSRNSGVVRLCTCDDALATAVLWRAQALHTPQVLAPRAVAGNQLFRQLLVGVTTRQQLVLYLFLVVYVVARRARPPPRSQAGARRSDAASVQVLHHGDPSYGRRVLQG